jgi:hypothetical protein
VIFLTLDFLVVPVFFWKTLVLKKPSWRKRLIASPFMAFYFFLMIFTWPLAYGIEIIRYMPKGTGRVNAETLVVRAQASSGAAEVLTLKRGARLTPAGKPDGGWLPVEGLVSSSDQWSYKKYSGFADAASVTIDGEADPAFDAKSRPLIATRPLALMVPPYSVLINEIKAGETVMSAGRALFFVPPFSHNEYDASYGRRLVTYKGKTGYVNAGLLADPSLSLSIGTTPADWGAAAEEQSRPLFIRKKDRKSDSSAPYFDAPLSVKEGAIFMGELQNWTLVESAGGEIQGAGGGSSNRWQPIRVGNKTGYIRSKYLWPVSGEATVTAETTTVMFNNGSVNKPVYTQSWSHVQRPYLDIITVKKGTKFLLVQKKLEPLGPEKGDYLYPVYTVAQYYKIPDDPSHIAYYFAMVPAGDVSIKEIAAASVSSKMKIPVELPKRPSFIEKVEGRLAEAADFFERLVKYIKEKKPEAKAATGD